MKIMKHLFFLCALFMACTISAYAVDYCVPTMRNNMVGYIENVATTGAYQDVNFNDPLAQTNTGSAHYTAAANKVVNSDLVVLPGQEIALTTNALFARWGEIHVFFDYNGDGEFDASEKVAHFGDVNNATEGNNNEQVLAQPQTAQLTIPADISGGTIRMRVIIAGGTYADSGNNGCSDLANQEGAFYDFEVTVKKIVEYCTPSFTGTGYVGTITSATTTGATTNLLYEMVDNYPKGIVGNEIIAEPGQTINLTVNVKNLYWGYIQLFADLNGDGSFEDFNSEDVNIEKLGEWAKGYGEAGNHKYDPDGGASIALEEVPAIVIPADFPEGTFRIRAVIGSSNKAGACTEYTDGGYWDFVVNVKQQVNTYTINYTAETEGGTLALLNGSTTVESGTSVPEGTILSIVATPAADYELSVVNVNGAEYIGSQITVTEDLNVTAEFRKIDTGGSAMSIPATTSGKRNRFQFDDLLLGVHKNGTNNTDPSKIDKGDYRGRNLTMSAWIKTSSVTGDLFGYTQAAFYGAEGAFAVNLVNGKLALRHREWTGGGNAPGMGNTVSETAGLANKWAFVTVVINDTDKKLSLYKDGEFVLEKVMESGKYGIGFLSDESAFFFGNGGMGLDLDEVQLWNRSLTESEILSSMAGYETSPEGLIYFYKFGPDNLEADNTFANKGCPTILPAATPGEPTNVCPSKFVSGTVSGGVNYNATTTVPEFVGGRVSVAYSVTYNDEVAGGSFVVKSGGQTIASGATANKGSLITVETNADEGYQVKSIKVNDVAIEGNSFSLLEDVTIVVEFTNKLSLTYSATEGGEIRVESGGVELADNAEFDKNSTIKITLTADEGYEITTFTVNEVDSKELLEENILEIENVETNLDIKAVFAKKKFIVTIPTTEGGSISVKDGTTAIANGASVDFGTELTIKLTPNKVAALTAFTVNGENKMGELVDNEMKITIREDLTLAATFEWIKYTLSVTNKTPDFGTVVAKDDSNSGLVLESGDKVIKDHYIQIVITPNDDSAVYSLNNNGETISLTNNPDIDTYDDHLEYWFDMNADIAIEVVFTTPVNIASNKNIIAAYYDNATKVLHLEEGTIAAIYDLTGKKVVECSQSTNVSGLANGCYLARVVTKDGINTIKFVKE